MFSSTRCLSSFKILPWTRRSKPSLSLASFRCFPVTTRISGILFSNLICYSQRTKRNCSEVGTERIFAFFTSSAQLRTTKFLLNLLSILGMPLSFVCINFFVYFPRLSDIPIVIVRFFSKIAKKIRTFSAFVLNDL